MTPPPTAAKHQPWPNPVITLTRAAAHVETAGGPIHVVRQLRQAASRCELDGISDETAAAYDEALCWLLAEVEKSTPACHVMLAPGTYCGECGEVRQEDAS